MKKFNIKISKDPNKNWENNEIQFARLIAELESSGVWLNEELLHSLMCDMDLNYSEVIELVDRACLVWDKVKDKTKFNPK